MKLGHRLQWIAENLTLPGYERPTFDRFVAASAAADCGPFRDRPEDRLFSGDAESSELRRILAGSKHV